MIFTPWLNGERTPVDDHTLRGGWHNLSLATTRAELVRSVLEGVAYNSRWLLGYVEKFIGQPFPWLHFIGGGAQSELWCRIMADVLDRAIRQVEHPIRANARGAALLARHRARADRRSTTSPATSHRARPSTPDRAHHGDLRRAVPRVPRDPQADQGHLREAARPCLTGAAPTTGCGTTSRCAAGDCPNPVSSTGSSSCRRTSTTRCSVARSFMAVHPGVDRRDGVRREPAAYPRTRCGKWDVQIGFAPGDDVMEARRHEDDAALALLDANARAPRVRRAHLQPGRPARRARGARRRCSSPRSRGSSRRSCIAPFGLANPDHDVTHRACMLARDHVGDTVSWWCYEDTGYKHIPGMLAWRVSSLFRRGVWPTPVCPPIDVTDGARKAAAVACYPSQLLALEDDWRSAPSSPRPHPSSSGASRRRRRVGSASPKAPDCRGTCRSWAVLRSAAIACR